MDDKTIITTAITAIVIVAISLVGTDALELAKMAISAMAGFAIGKQVRS